MRSILAGDLNHLAAAALHTDLLDDPSFFHHFNGACVILRGICAVARSGDGMCRACSAAPRLREGFTKRDKG